MQKDILLNSVGHTERTSSGKYEMHKATVEMYLCSDGKLFLIVLFMMVIKVCTMNFVIVISAY